MSDILKVFELDDIFTFWMEISEIIMMKNLLIS